MVAVLTWTDGRVFLANLQKCQLLLRFVRCFRFSHGSRCPTGKRKFQKSMKSRFFRFSDIDECTTGSNNCAVGTATCTNIPGRFTCACNSGYSGNGVICTGEELKKCLIFETLIWIMRPVRSFAKFRITWCFNQISFSNLKKSRQISLFISSITSDSLLWNQRISISDPRTIASAVLAESCSKFPLTNALLFEKLWSYASVTYWNFEMFCRKKKKSLTRQTSFYLLLA